MAEKKTPAKKTPAKKAPAKKAAASKAPAKKAPAKKAAAKKTPAKRAQEVVKASAPVEALKVESPQPKIYENNVPSRPSKLEIMKRWFRRL